MEVEADEMMNDNEDSNWEDEAFSLLADISDALNDVTTVEEVCESVCDGLAGLSGLADVRLELGDGPRVSRDRIEVPVCGGGDELGVLHLVLESREPLMGLDPVLRTVANMAGLAIARIRLSTRLPAEEESEPSRLDDRPLTESLEALADEDALAPSIDVTVEVEGATENLAGSLSSELYEMARRRLTEIERHADATSVTVRLVTGDEDIELSLEDDGAGLAAGGEAESGLEELDEWARRLGGQLAVELSWEGSRVEVKVPRED